jgi:exonuclease SbcC
MHLKRIELTNFRQHKQLDVDFEGNMIAVLGRNGSGKSNLIGAIQFALTGAQPGFTKADLTTWGEKEGSVKLIFTAGSNNTEFVIVRKTNGDVTMKVGDETIKQSKKVEEALREKAGLDKDLINQIVFVPQKGIDSILFDDPKNREVAFQRLIGIGNASKIYDALRTEIAAYDKPQGFDEAINRSLVQMNEQAEIVKTCKATLDKYDTALTKLPSKEQLEAEVDKLASAQAAIEELVSVTKRLESAQEAHERALKGLNEVGSVSEVREDELRKSIDCDNDIIRFLSRLKELSESAQRSKNRLDTAKGELEHVQAKYANTLGEMQDDVERRQRELDTLVHEKASLEKMIAAASSDGTCPLCGAQASQEDIQKHVGDRISELATAIAATEENLKPLVLQVKRRKASEDSALSEIGYATEDHNRQMKALQNAKDKNVEGVEIDMASFEVIYKGNVPADLPKIEARLAENRRELAAAISVQDAAKTARDNVARYAAQVDMLVQSKHTAAKRVADMGMDPDGIEFDASEKCRAATAKARANLDAYNGILRDIAAEKGRLEAAEKTIETTKKLIDDLAAKKEVEDKVKEKVDTLKRVRDWFNVGPIAA